MEAVGAAVTAVFSLVTALFGFPAFILRRNRPRLEFFERRRIRHDRTAEYCSMVLQDGGLPDRGSPGAEALIAKMLESAGESFRGIGGHKARLLSGQDIAARSDCLNEAHGHLRAYRSAGAQFTVGRNVAKCWGYVTEVMDELTVPPEQFSSCLHFGDYRSRRR